MVFHKPLTISYLPPPYYKNCDCILSFVPPILSGRLAIELRNKLGLSNRKLIQFWTDPLSLGRCDSVNDIPWSRIIHKWQERRLLKVADKVVFCYPLLCEMEKQLHHKYAHKMTWSDISYMIHAPEKNKIQNQKPLIGFFGAYQNRVRNIRPLFEAIKNLPECQFIIRGDGDLPENIGTISNLNLESGRKSLAEIEELENQCDILLSLSGKSGLTHPAGKTFYYASYNTPIIHIGDGDNSDYFEKYISGFEGRFIHCHNNEQSITKAIRKAVSELSNFELHIPSRMDAATIAKKIIED